MSATYPVITPTFGTMPRARSLIWGQAFLFRCRGASILKWSDPLGQIRKISDPSGIYRGRDPKLHGGNGQRIRQCRHPCFQLHFYRDADSVLIYPLHQGGAERLRAARVTGFDIGHFDEAGEVGDFSKGAVDVLDGDIGFFRNVSKGERAVERAAVEEPNSWAHMHIRVREPSPGSCLLPRPCGGGQRQFQRRRHRPRGNRQR